jgi:hypothetical protein
VEPVDQVTATLVGQQGVELDPGSGQLALEDAALLVCPPQSGDDHAVGLPLAEPSNHHRVGGVGLMVHHQYGPSSALITANTSSSHLMEESALMEVGRLEPGESTSGSAAIRAAMPN